MEAYDYAYKYGRCAEAEKMILEDRGWIYMYARHVIKDRWPEGELLLPYMYAGLYAEEFNLDINIKFSERKKSNES